MMPNQRPRPASLVDDLPRWRARLERIWRLQVEEIIELSLAYHDAASAPRVGGMPEQASSSASQLREVLSRTALAHHALAEIEAAMGRIDAASYGVCEQCGLRLDAGWLEASPQVRYCRGCCLRDRWRHPSGAAAGSAAS
jgi:RNA polymerase-binding transcription factor DksA